MREPIQHENRRKGLVDTVREIVLWLCAIGAILGGWLLADYINALGR